MNNLTKLSLTAFLFSAVSATPLLATVILPGQTITTAPAATGIFTQLPSTVLNPTKMTETIKFGGSGNNKDVGTLETLVGTDTSNPYGPTDLTFVYQFSLTRGDVSEISVSDFTGFTTDVYVSAGNLSDFSATTHLAPSSISRSDVGDNIQFYFVPNNVAVGSSNISTSFILIVDTDATSWTTNTLGLTDSGGQNLEGFSPEGNPTRAIVPPVPEPSSLLLLGTGLLGVGAVVRRRVSI